MLWWAPSPSPRNFCSQHVADSLTRLQPARLALRTLEDYVETSGRDYDNGDYAQCVSDATESLKLRPGMPAAWYNISVCSAQCGDWDAAVAAATAAMRIEPESDILRKISSGQTLSGSAQPLPARDRRVVLIWPPAC